jgi:DNA-binding GntR family transcriptional regulator
VPSAKTRPANGRMKHQAYDELKRRILADAYPPGTLLAERRLAADLGMSKTPIKAAVERLEAEGFVAVSPQQGILVREPTVADIVDQYEARAALETYVLRSVAGRLTPAQAERLRENLQEQDDHRATGDLARGMELDAGFHVLFAEFLGNREIVRMMGQLRERMQRVIAQVFRLHPARFDGSVSEHTAIAQAVVRGDGAKAAALLEQHLQRGRQLILSPRGAA